MLTALQVLATCILFFFFGVVFTLVVVWQVVNKMVIDGKIEVTEHD